MICFNTNLKAGSATTQFMNFEFNSMVKFAGKYIGASDNGLFTLGGDLDDESLIAASFELPNSDFGINNHKRLRHIYFGVETYGDLEIICTVDDKDHRTYKIQPVKGRTGQQRIRIPVGRDIKGRYWSFRINNPMGCDFSVDSVEILPVVLPYGHR